MVCTRAREATASRGDSPRGGVSSPPDPPPQQSPTDRDLLIALAKQVDTLASAVRDLQQQPARGQPTTIVPPTAPIPISTRRSPARLPPRPRYSRSRSPRRLSRRSRRSPTPDRASPVRESSRGRRARSPSESSGERSLGLSQEGSTEEAARRHADRRLEDHERELCALSHQLAHLREGRESANYGSRPPLSRRILEAPILERFKMPTVEPYDGTSDPLDHLESYKALMRIQGATDALLCIAFPATLRKAARVWYSRLEPRSVDSFAQLEGKFLAHFSACRRMPREPDSLFTIRQQDKESLRDYVARFKAATLEVYSLDDSLAMSALKRGLRASRLTFSLDKNPARSYAEVLQRAEKYIRTDEGANSRCEAEGKGKKPREESRAPPANRPDSSRPRSPRRSRESGSRPTNLPLLAPPSKILMEIEGETYLRRPEPLRSDRPRNMKKFCHFHRDHGHDMDDCFQLNREIESLIQRGYLDKFIRRPDGSAKGKGLAQPRLTTS